MRPPLVLRITARRSSSIEACGNGLLNPAKVAVARTTRDAVNQVALWPPLASSVEALLKRRTRERGSSIGVALLLSQLSF